MRILEQRQGAVVVLKPEGALVEQEAEAFKQRLMQALGASLGGWFRPMVSGRPGVVWWMGCCRAGGIGGGRLRSYCCCKIHYSVALSAHTTESATKQRIMELVGLR